ncbi:MAG: hypothetical protein MUO77_01105 [Anaerolineales bacterium]|nr:hypothetical protein [Anaerolineales bacterium]
MTTGFPKPPTCLSIGLGISLFALSLLAFFHIPDIVKSTGTVLMFVPAKLGIIDMVMPQDVVPQSIEHTPSTITISKPGHYLFYTDNYDLLVINNAIAGSDAKPWMNMQSTKSGTKVEVTMIERGLSIFDTPFAHGRPVLSFTITEPGTYQMKYPTRPGGYLYLVPDVTTGKETLITFMIVVEVSLVGGVVVIMIRRRTAPSRELRKKMRANNRARVERWQERHPKQEEGSSCWKRPG